MAKNSGPPPASYEVGYAKPPAATRFRKGESGNPAGRLKGSKNLPRLHEERLKSIIIEEAYRTIQVNDGNGQVTMSMAQAIMRSLAVSAAKGQTRAQKLFMEMLSHTEQSNKQLYDEYVQTLLEYKYSWEAALKQCERVGVEPPDLFPHPNQIKVDYRTGQVWMVGPFREEDRERYRYLRQRKKEFTESVAMQKNALPTMPEKLRKVFKDSIAQEQKIVDMIAEVIPD